MKLCEIFPSVRRGSFSWDKDLQRWVWTSFNSFSGILTTETRCLRRDGRRVVGPGKSRSRHPPSGCGRLSVEDARVVCENLPEAHTLIRAFCASVPNRRT